MRQLNTRSKTILEITDLKRSSQVPVHTLKIRDMDPHYLKADPDPAFFQYADPDPGFFCTGTGSRPSP